MYQDKLTRMAREYRQRAMLGTWCKTGRGRYERITGEIVEKQGNQWFCDGLFWQSLWAAMSRIDYLHRNE
jgi:hypothetical protein